MIFLEGARRKQTTIRNARPPEWFFYGAA